MLIDDYGNTYTYLTRIIEDMEKELDTKNISKIRFESSSEDLMQLLQKEKATAQMYLDLSGTIFVVIGVDEKIKLLNKKGVLLLGIKAEEAIGKNWFDNFIPEAKREEERKLFYGALKSKKSVYEHFESKIIDTSGKEHLISWNTTTIRNENGEITATLSSGNDFTSQNKTEKKLSDLNKKLEQKVIERTQELRESQRLYKSIARNIPNGMVSVFDKSLNYLFAEGTELHSLGIPSEKVIGTNYLDKLPKEIVKETESKLKKVFNGENISYELSLSNNTYLINAVGLNDEQGRVKQILLVEKNITQQKKAQKLVQNTLNKEIQLNVLKSRFLSIASHEFRTPLTSIMLSSSLLEKYIEKEDSKGKKIKHLNRIKSSVRNLTSILNDFLSLEKLEENKHEVRLSKFSILEIIKELLDEMGEQKKEKQQIIFEHSGSKIIKMDQQILRNVLNNLISNAIKYSKEDGEIKIFTKVENNNLYLKIEDEGIGIPMDEQHHLFERFFRSKNAINIEGTGLGLSIVKKYLDLLKGEIHFTSIENIGTKFEINIPIIVK